MNGVLGALGSCFTFMATVTIIPFMPEGWAGSAGGFPAMTGDVPFLTKDVVLPAVSFHLLRQDLVRVSLAADPDRRPTRHLRRDDRDRPNPTMRQSIESRRLRAR